jgi:hypothetical protein
MGNAGDGAALRASFSAASGASRTPVGRTHRHKFGTVAKLAANRDLQVLEKWWPGTLLNSLSNQVIG